MDISSERIRVALALTALFMGLAIGVVSAVLLFESASALPLITGLGIAVVLVVASAIVLDRMLS